MGFLISSFDYVVVFLIILTVIIFVHELGHFLAARFYGVRVEIFSLGFGSELFGWTSRAGTRWRVSALPIGGYVKMAGDADPSSRPGPEIEQMSAAEKAVSLHHKPLRQRAAVAAAGPLANFVLAIVVQASLFATVGQQFTRPEVGQVELDSAAAAAGIRPGDLILSVDGHSIARFEDISEAVRLDPGKPLTLVLERDQQQVSLVVTPRVTELTDRFGNQYRLGLLGIRSHGVNYVKRSPGSAVFWAVNETGDEISSILTSVWQMIIGVRGADELGGPLRIAQMSGEVAQGGVLAVISFMAMLSVNIGLVNLFPIPILDGGHLLFYAAEAIRGKPLGPRAQEYGFRLGFALVLTLVLFVTWNDLVHLKVLPLLKRLIT